MTLTSDEVFFDKICATYDYWNDTSTWQIWSSGGSACCQVSFRYHQLHGFYGKSLHQLLRSLFLKWHMWSAPGGLLGQKVYTPARTALRTPYPHWHIFSETLPLVAQDFGKNPYPYWHNIRKWLYPLWHNCCSEMIHRPKFWRKVPKIWPLKCKFWHFALSLAQPPSLAQGGG